MMGTSQISIEEFKQLIERELPFAQLMNIEPLSLEADQVKFVAKCDDSALRPGGTVAGPVMMGLADAAIYGLVLANRGMVALAVTTNLSINFLRKPGPGDLFCTARPLKLGKRLVVCEATLFSGKEGESRPVAHVTGTYSIPPI